MRVQRASLHCFDSDPNLRWLFFFAHPDDELGMAGWMSRLSTSGNPFRCAWAHANPVREVESRAVMASVSPRAELRFGEFPDGAFVDHLPALLEWVLREITDFEPDRVVTVAFEQGHLDHDALSLAVSRAAGCPVLEYPMYHHYGHWVQRVGRFADPIGEEILLLSDAEAPLKRALLNGYPSQTVRRNVRLLETTSKITGRNFDLFGKERLRLQPTPDPKRCIHSGRDKHRVERSREWKRWLAAIRELVGSNEWSRRD